MIECPVCMGKKILDCPQCDGAGEILCPSCDGRRKQSADKECPYCEDEGYIKCSRCNGKARINCPDCKAIGEVTGNKAKETIETRGQRSQRSEAIRELIDLEEERAVKRNKSRALWDTLKLSGGIMVFSGIAIIVVNASDNEFNPLVLFYLIIAGLILYFFSKLQLFLIKK